MTGTATRRRTTAAALTALCAASPAFAERGTDGELRLMLWQAPSTLNVYLSTGTKDMLASSLVLEPLAGFAPDGSIYPRLAAEIPTTENGGLAEDLTSITWTLKEGLTWSDGSPVTAEDVKFTADYCMDPQGGCAQLAKFEGIDKVEVVDPRTVKISFTEPRPNPYEAFVGSLAPVIQKAQFADCTGARTSSCTDQNFGPIGTGPFRVTRFLTNDVSTYEANPEYRDPSLPAFATVTLKGGGDSASAARAVLETGEYDYGWNVQLSPEVLQGMLAAGKGQLEVDFGATVEHVVLNMSDPSPDLSEGERSTIQHPHPILSDERVRRALSMAIDRNLLNEVGYGDTGRATCNMVPAPEVFAADNTDCLTQDIEGARALLDEAGWTDSDGDGVRDKDGRKLSLLFQSSVNSVRQDFQALIKQWWSEIGVETELKTVDASVFFGSDPGSPDTLTKFYADAQMYTTVFDGTDPGSYLAKRTCDKAPGPENQWQGENAGRYCDPEYDALIDELGRTAGIEKRGELARQANLMLTRDSMGMLPLIARGRVSVSSNRLDGVQMNAWDSEFWNIAEWSRAAE
ncbi:peptide ABC transporter substrate-binding protein [Paracoccus stylophorae]|uniref:Peptide ABC transporter substrate-binding protein n=1 Tax=Paracoccus stylophorae TaxID=659350 RepID=A0ABY7SSN3_9RHOB|nr:peptide ABC transporter substrate-binding protein [Paracoccus stylophorae]WCR10037.1 peptide ABC transporter substrate-binding protein [Paracoccus stylophorae]